LHKLLGNYQVATELVASRVVLNSIELVGSLTMQNGSEYQQSAMLFFATSNFNSLYDPDIKFVYEIRRSILVSVSWAGFKRIHLAVFQAPWVEVFGRIFH
jgi:hypothetical protein